MNPQVKFYQMTSWPLERTLPRLMEMAHERGIRALIHGPWEVLERIDKAMWTFKQLAFLPHGTERDPYPDEQPILLSTGWNPLNRAPLLVIVDGSLYDGEISFERLFDLFDGTDEESLAAARARWNDYKKRGWDVSFARQKDDGSWDEKAA